MEKKELLSPQDYRKFTCNCTNFFTCINGDAFVGDPICEPLEDATYGRIFRSVHLSNVKDPPDPALVFLGTNSVCVWEVANNLRGIGEAFNGLV